MQPEAPFKLKGFPGGEIAKVAELVNYRNGSIVSHEIVKKSTGKVTIFSFDKEQGLNEHTAPFDTLVHAIEGEAEITVAGQPHCLHCGEMILMPAQQAHALKALKRFKMILTMIHS
jgi:quercetin dioxygenase-like cupin family protein